MLRLWKLQVLLLAVQVLILFAQEKQIEQIKKNPISRPMEISKAQKDTIETPTKTRQRPLPKFDLPEYIITGTASVDLPKLENISVDYSPITMQPISKPTEKILRDRETLELEMKGRDEDSKTQTNIYSGFIKVGIGTYFTPLAELQYGQTLPEYFYSFGGKYFLTKGYAQNTDQSGGSFSAFGGTSLISSLPIFQNAAINGELDYRSESFHFYGSATPNLQRTISDFLIQTILENQTLNHFPYSVGISLESTDISDSSTSKTETRLDLNYQTSFLITSLIVRTNLQLIMATGGISFMNLSAKTQDYLCGDLLLEGSLHLYWAKGMEEQNLVRLYPELKVSYQATSQHRLFASYQQIIVPMTLASNIIENRFLSATSIVRHEDVTGMGELGIESSWTDAVRSRVYLNVKFARDLPMFSDSSRQGVWMLAYGGQTTIATFCAEMVAKLNSNDYFASNILLRSTNNSFIGGKIPYAPAIEVLCSAIHRFGTAVAVSANARFTGERTTDLSGRTTLPKHTIVDVSCEYTPINFLRLAVGIRNLTDSQFEIWRGYREFPLTMQIDVQIKW